jgi:hypothetical protein
MAVGYTLVGFFHGNELQLILTSCAADVGAGIVVAGAPALVAALILSLFLPPLRDPAEEDALPGPSSA